jgi:signal peptidase II
MRGRFGLRLLLMVTLVATIGCDRVTKRLATASLAGLPDRAFLGNTIRLGYAENAGGFLSLGAELPERARVAIFVVASGALLALVSFAIVRGQRNGGVLLGATLFLAGGASNWLDRVVHGSVVDFLNLGVGSFRTGIFNVADVAIMAGLALLVYAHAAADQPSAE